MTNFLNIKSQSSVDGIHCILLIPATLIPGHLMRGTWFIESCPHMAGSSIYIGSEDGYASGGQN